MIYKKDILQIGHTQKPYGIKGEIVFFFLRVEYADLDVDYYLLDMDGIPVPYFVEDYKYTTDVTARVKLEWIENEQEASKLVNKKFYLPRTMVKTIQKRMENDWNYFIGYDVIDNHGKLLGSIREVDDSTINVLFLIDSDEGDILIPATKDFIINIDEENRFINMNLPDGLLD